jgi:hypothetical protein
MHMTFGRLGAVDRQAKMSGMEGALPAVRTLPRIDRMTLLIIVVALGESLLAAYLALYGGRPWAWAVLLTIPVALAWRAEPWKAASSIAVGSMFLRFAYIGTATDDQILVTHAALARVLTGLSPYGVGYTESIPSGSPFPYGPLALLWWIPGPAVELVAATGIMALLIHYRSWLALAAFCAFPPFVYLNATGVNDYSPALLIGLGLMMLPRWQGAVALAAAAALKPYAFAWFLPAIGFGGMPILLALVGASAVLWAPLLLWGPGTFLATVGITDRLHGAGTAVRYLAIPASLAGLLWRSRSAMILTGCAAFALYLFTSGWWSVGYLIPLVVALGVQHGTSKTKGQR